MKLILHIGTEKTGTSSIQETLFKNKSSLLKAGIYFSQCAGQHNNINFALCCMNDGREDEDNYFTSNNIATPKKRTLFYESVKQSFEQEIAALEDVHTVIISSEHFHSLLIHENEVLKLKQLLGDYFSSIEVVCYLREQVSTCVSHYSTRIKTGDSESLEHFIKRCTPENPYYDYLALLDRWALVFGEQNLMVNVFDRNSLVNNDIVDDFFYQIGVDLIKHQVIKCNEKNISLNYIGQCLLKAINSEFSAKQQVPPKLLQFIHKQFAGQGEHVNADTYRHLYESFDSINKAVNLKYFGKKEELFSYSPPASTNIIEGAERVVKELLPLIDFTFSLTIEDSYADVCRDVAVSFENSSIETAFKLMSLAHKIRPNGPLIKKKLMLYKNYTMLNT